MWLILLAQGCRRTFVWDSPHQGTGHYFSPGIHISHDTPSARRTARLLRRNDLCVYSCPRRTSPTYFACRLCSSERYYHLPQSFLLESNYTNPGVHQTSPHLQTRHRAPCVRGGSARVLCCCRGLMAVSPLFLVPLTVSGMSEGNNKQEMRATGALVLLDCNS